MKFLLSLWHKYRRRIAGFGGPIRLQRVQGDVFPAHLARKVLIELDDDGPYAVALRCPCGCGETIELMLMKGVHPRWDLQADAAGLPTLNPSVWRQSGCRSHFWLRNGRVIWCD
jgi:Family of unknown function (DUF6527)